MSLGPWSVMGCLLILRKWEANRTLEELDFDFSPFWVQIQGLPFCFLNAKSGLKIAEALGEVIAVADPEKERKLMKFIRVRVWVDITKPLKRGFFLRRPGEENLWVKFRYERLSNFCYSCGRVGHNFNECKEKDESKEKTVYDGDLRAKISWLDTINFGIKEPTKFFYPDSRNRSSRGGDDGSAAASQAHVSTCHNPDPPLEQAMIKRG
ncbi:uncharacterized protein At4g02000-like [Rhododendron vialii]|uniref:uncharacterized protein At4g02000-like n=1 Tax=Rhododendron vialii TaxID=182163 RepID=UPI00265E57BD|nr:uncharacterized protein At4g02000-like [Rhododendron vialii]